MSDPVRTASTAVATVGGAAVGAAAAPMVAGAVGATSIPVITTAASWLGVTVVAATPIGWILGCAAVVGALGFGAAKLAADGGETEGERYAHDRQMTEMRETAKRQSRRESLSDCHITKLKSEVRAAVVAERISSNHGNRIEAAVKNGSMSLVEAHALCSRKSGECF